jgi:dienelactone hydrolase
LLALGTTATWSAGCRTTAALRLLSDAQRPAHELADGVDEEELSVEGTAVLLYRPSGADGPWPGLLLCHGAVDLGARDARMVALARALVRRGFLVACPELVALRAFRADPGEVERLARLAAWLADQSGSVEPDGVALAGISIGGSYCILAASRPAARERVRAVLAFGAYAELEALVRTWMVAARTGPPELLDPFVEGRRRVLLGNLAALLPEQELAPVRGWLVRLLAGSPVPELDTSGLSSAGARVVACASATGPIDPLLVEAVLAPIATSLRALSPGQDESAPAAPLFLLHGEGDPIVPPSDAETLRATLEPLGTPVRVHVTGAFSHVTGGGRASLWSSWRLARFVAAFLAAAGL